MPPTIFCVLRSGGDFDVSDVVALQAGVARQSGAELVCLSDVDVPGVSMAIKHFWPGWWSKMELFRPDIRGDIFYLDLDTVIVGDLQELLFTQSLDTMLSDFYYPEHPASGLMYITEQSKAAVWSAWINGGPERTMRDCGSGGDQKFLGMLPFGKQARRWQLEFPGQVISFKAQMRPQQPRYGQQLAVPPKDARLVCFHGKPRPKNVREPWVIAARSSAEMAQ